MMLLFIAFSPAKVLILFETRKNMAIKCCLQQKNVKKSLAVSKSMLNFANGNSLPEAFTFVTGRLYNLNF